MSTQEIPPSVTSTPNYHHALRPISTSPSTGQLIYLRQPPEAYLGQQPLSRSSLVANTYEHLKKENVSVSGASIGSSHQTSHHPGTGSSKLYSLTFSLSSQAEQGSLEYPRQTRVYSNQYTRPSRSEMAEISAAYQGSLESNGLSEKPKDHAVLTLIWLCLLDPLYCLFAALYTLITLFPLLLLWPLSLCGSRYHLSSSTIRLISPISRRHLRILGDDSTELRPNVDYRPLSLILVYLVAPSLSLGVAIAAWVTALFWGFAITMGNPDGTEKQDDGRIAVLGVRNSWRKFLLLAVR